MARTINEITGIIVDAAIKIHSLFGPGLLESFYMAALAAELRRRGLRVDREVPIRVDWEGDDLGVAYRADMIVEDVVIVEGKAVEQNSRIHARQLRTHVILSKRKVGLVLNFGLASMKDGIVRHVEGLDE